LGRERILRAVDGTGGGERYEIFHDVLADGVLAWRARRVLERDRERARRRQHRLVVVAAAALLALAGMTAVAVYALTERSHARSAARQARARAHEAKSLFEQSTDPEHALVDAVAAARSDPGARAEGVLRQALVADHERRVLRAPGPVSVVAFASKGGRVLSGDAGGAGGCLLAGWPPGCDARHGKASRGSRLRHAHRPVAAPADPAGRARGRCVLSGQPLACDDELPGHVPLERPQRPAVRSAP